MLVQVSIIIFLTDQRCSHQFQTTRLIDIASTSGFDINYTSHTQKLMRRGKSLYIVPGKYYITDCGTLWMFVFIVYHAGPKWKLVSRPISVHYNQPWPNGHSQQTNVLRLGEKPLID